MMQKILLLSILSISSLANAFDCPKWSFLVKNVEAYQLDFREIWGEHYELSVSNTLETTPKNFYGDLIINDSEILESIAELKLPVVLENICVRLFIEDDEEKLVLTSI